MKPHGSIQRHDLQQQGPHIHRNRRKIYTTRWEDQCTQGQWSTDRIRAQTPSVCSVLYGSKEDTWMQELQPLQNVQLSHYQAKVLEITDQNWQQVTSAMGGHWFPFGPSSIQANAVTLECDELKNVAQWNSGDRREHRVGNGESKGEHPSSGRSKPQSQHSQIQVHQEFLQAMIKGLASLSRQG